MKNEIRNILLFILFIILISWTSEFTYLSFKDLKLLMILLLSTGILVLLSGDDWNNLSSRFRFNLFFTGLVMTLFLELDYISQLNESLLEDLLLGIKPLLFCLVIYGPGNILARNIEEKWAENKSITYDFSNREREVYELIVKGLTNKEMSERLFIAETTVKKHVQNILKKTNKSRKDELINEYEELKL